MRGERFSSNGIGRLILSLTVAVFMLGPIVCSYACAADDLAPRASISAHVVSVDSAAAIEHSAEQGSPCPDGGHCHHTPAADLRGQPVAASEAVYAAVERHLVGVLPPESLAPIRLERPPRA